MNLKEYAIARKLSSNSELLKYVLDGKPVPINVIESDFEYLIQDLKNEEVEQLASDFRTYLKSTVSVGIHPVKDSNDTQFEISGEIDDVKLQVIEMLHNQDKETVVKNLVEDVMKPLVGERVLTVGEIVFSESVAKLVAQVEEQHERLAPITTFEEQVIKPEHDNQQDLNLEGLELDVQEQELDTLEDEDQEFDEFELEQERDFDSLDESETLEGQDDLGFESELESESVELDEAFETQDEQELPELDITLNVVEADGSEVLTIKTSDVDVDELYVEEEFEEIDEETESEETQEQLSKLEGTVTNANKVKDIRDALIKQLNDKGIFERIDNFDKKQD